MHNKSSFTPVRFSHLTSYASIGAIVRDANDMLMVVTDIRYWTDKSNEISATYISNVIRIIRALELGKDLRMPPIAKELDNGEIDGDYLPAVLFPTYAVCKKCGLLHNDPWNKQNIRLPGDAYCENCNKEKLVQSTWCAVSSAGHLDNVPWHYICHRKPKGDCKVDYEKAYLRITNDANGNKIVLCTRCGAKNRYEGIKTPKKPDKKRWLHLTKPQPWLWKDAVMLDSDDSIEILETNNSGVYQPERVNALVIPPESRINKNSVIDKLFNNSKLCREIEAIKMPLRKKGKLKQLATKYRTTVEVITNALEDIKNGYPFLDDMVVGDDLLEDEYKAFLEPLENIEVGEDFVTDHQSDQWRNLESELSGELQLITKFVDHLIVANRLREIQVFKGFYRVSQDAKDKRVPPHIMGECDWLPAIELFGEGVFFTLDTKLLSAWEKLPGVIKRADEIALRYGKAEVVLHQDINITPRFLLLHTLSHLLIRELETTAGYPAASLKERVYCSTYKNMSGILIYTVVADIVGSLGGIIESAEPKAFLSLLEGAIRHAQWCSLDPVCTEHEGQGPGWLNRAACHACALVPEPSCDFNNVLLDRVFIKGSNELGIPSLIEFAEDFNR